MRLVLTKKLLLLSPHLSFELILKRLFQTKNKMQQNLTKIAFTFYLVFLVCNSMNSQTTSSDNNIKLLKKNIFQVSLAPDIAYNAVHIFYDRIIYENNNIAAFARVG